MKQLNSLLIQLEEALEECWTAYANYEIPSDDIYFVLEDLAALDVGGVYIPTQSGRMAWLNVESQQFE